MNVFWSLFILLLLGGCLSANGQENPPVATGQPLLMPKVERHQNPDYATPDAKTAGSRRKPKRLKLIGEYAIPIGSNQDSTLTHLTESGLRFRISPDGKWLIVSQPNGEIESREPLYRQGLFGGPRPYGSDYPIRP